METMENTHGHRRVFFFVDNAAARASLIKMVTGVFSMRKVLLRISEHSQSTQTFSWYCRVASPSNPADAPSRLERLEVLTDTSQEVSPDLSWLERQ